MKKLIFILLCASYLFFPCITAWGQDNSFAIQSTTLPAEANADALINNLQAKGVEAYSPKTDIAGGESNYQVDLDQLASKAAAQQLRAQVRSLLHTCDHHIISNIADFKCVDTDGRNTKLPDL